MLTQIHIRDLATIEELHLFLHAGCTMITGETGAGKSIFIEAIELALGGRASTHIIRPGKERADISLCFDITQEPKVMTWLKNNDLYHDNNECILRRVITSDGRSRSYINGLPSTLQSVRELGELLFHLHGQYEQQVLLKAENQRDILDRYAGHLALVAEVKHVAEEWKSINKEINALREQIKQRTEHYHELRFQQEELLALQMRTGEWEALESEHHKLTHAEELMRHLQEALHHLTEDQNRNVCATLNDIRKLLEPLQAVDAKISEWLNTLQSASIQLNDLEMELRHYLETTELDPKRLHDVEGRIQQIFNLARKYKVAPLNLIHLQEQLTNELNTLESSDTTLEHLITQQKKFETTYAELTQTLSQSRAKAATQLANNITHTIRSLSLPHGIFYVSLEKFENVETELSPYGQEKVTFLLKTNPDQTPKPIVKVISGGELSRLSLAIHLALAHRAITPTLIFDEVDTGVGGATAEKMGKLLRTLGKSYQVFCVTHQPQVAACGHHHLFVEKYFMKKNTYTRLRLLTKEERTTEIARMLGGEKITQKTVEHAEEILSG